MAARDVTLANVPGGKAKSIVHVESMRLAVRLVPLLHGRIEATEVALDRPDIALEVAADGSGNWELVRRHTEQSGLRLPANTLFSGITIRHGRVFYDNARLRLHRSIEALDADIALTRLADPAKATGSFVQRGRKLAFSATVGTIRTLLAGIATKVDMALDADFVHAAFLGFVSSDGTAKGSASLRTGSVRDLAAWLGRPLAAGGGLGPLTALADIAARGRHVVLTRLKAKLDGMSIGGTLAADLHAPVPGRVGRSFHRSCRSQHLSASRR
ncbi:MAG: AsmA family protein [Rhizomicrobium sp.]